MEKVNCILCGSDDHKIILETRDFRYRLCEDIFNIVKCRNCGLVFLNPRPAKNEMDKFYPSNYYNKRGGKFEKMFCNFLNRAKIKKIEKYKRRGRILDIGCGSGDFLSLFSFDGWQIYGVESSPIGHNLAVPRIKNNILNQSLTECKFPDNFFDVITLWHALEHIYDLNEELREIGRILKEDGILVISLPNINSFGFRMGKKYWMHLDSPRHLYHCSPETISRILNKNGFKAFRMLFPLFEFPLDFYYGFINSSDRKKYIRTFLLLPIALFSLIIKPIGYLFRVAETMMVFSKRIS